MNIGTINESDTGALRVKHLLKALKRCSPEARVVIAVHHGIPQVTVDGRTVFDLARAGITLTRSGLGTVVTLTNAVMLADGTLAAPKMPQLSTLDLPTNMNDKEKILAEIKRQTKVPMKDADAA